MRAATPEVRAVPTPEACSLNGIYPRLDLADSYAIALPPDAVRDPERLAHAMFDQPSPWVTRLMSIRDFVMARFGVKTARDLNSASPDALAERIAIFRIYRRSPQEILLGEDDRHLDFRLSVLVQASPHSAHEATLVVSTAVHCHNRLGHLYLAVIAPFHRVIVKATLRRAARSGWPAATAPDGNIVATAN